MTMLGMLGSTKGKPAKGAGLSLDLFQESFRANGKTPTFSEVVTHSRSGNATMVDSDGLLKWAPHNLVKYSEQFDNAAWSKTRCTVTPNQAVAPNGSLTADLMTATGADARLQINITNNSFFVTQSIWVKSATGSDVAGQIDFAGLDTLAFTANSEWQQVSTTSTNLSFSDLCRVRITNSGDSLYLWGAHLYRSDLGGMVDNPDRGDSYVPTTSSAVYLPRRGHHVYNGSAWVNEGLLHESEARTNLLLNSGTLATQIVTVTAVPHTLHFTGTGTVTLLGASTAGPLVGTGTGENNRVSLTFTPTAGTLTLTVSGTVTNAQLEAAPTPSSYIPTAGATVTRAAETLTIPSANLPWPTPQVIGDELVTNGTFDTDVSGWSAVLGTGSLSVTDGVVRLTKGDINPEISQTISVEVGKVYKVSADFIGQNGLEMRVDVGSFLGEFYATETTIERIIVATEPNPLLRIYSGLGVSGEYIEFDNISVREINPLSVSIQMDGRLGYADEGSAGQVTYAKWEADANNRIALTLDTDSTATGEVNFTQVAAGTADTVVSSATEYAPGILVPFNIASRHGSTFVNGAVDGVALTANTTPTALPDLSSTDLNLGYDMMGTIKTFRIWDKDLGDTGIEEASS